MKIKDFYNQFSDEEACKLKFKSIRDNKVWFVKSVLEQSIIDIKAYGNTSIKNVNLEPLFSVAS